MLKEYTGEVLQKQKECLGASLFYEKKVWSIRVFSEAVDNGDIILVSNGHPEEDEVIIMLSQLNLCGELFKNHRGVQQEDGKYLIFKASNLESLLNHYKTVDHIWRKRAIGRAIVTVVTFGYQTNPQILDEALTTLF